LRKKRDALAVESKTGLGVSRVVQFELRGGNHEKGAVKHKKFWLGTLREEDFEEKGGGGGARWGKERIGGKTWWSKQKT